MAFVENAPVVTLRQLELFTRQPVQNQIVDSVEEELDPLSQLNTGSHIEHLIRTRDNEFLKATDTFLRTRFRVILKKKNGEAIVEDDWKNISVINNIGHSLWSQVDLFVGETPTTTSLQTYPYKAYIGNIVNMRKDTKDTIGKMMGFTDDDFSTKEKANGPNENRASYIRWKAGILDKSHGQLCEVITPLYIELFNQPLNLIGGLQLKLRLIPSKPEFFFMVKDENLIPSIRYEKVNLIVNKNILGANVSYGIHKGLEEGDAKYPIELPEARHHVIDRGTTIRTLDNLVNGTLPRYVLLMLTSNEGMGGSYTKNPFYFDHYNIGSISCFANSVLVGKAQKPDYDLKFPMMEQYSNFLKVTGQWGNHINTTITPEMYANGFTIFAWDLTKDGSKGFFRSGYIDPPLDQSNLKFIVEFKSALPETVSAIVYCCWDQQINIDYLKNAIINGK